MSAKEQIDLYKSHWMNPGLQSTRTDPNPNPKEHPQAHFFNTVFEGVENCVHFKELYKLWR